MADLYEVENGDIAYGADLNQYKTALEGGSTQQFALFQKTGANFTIRMSTSNGSDKVSFTDSNNVEVASIDSDGNLAISGTFGSNNYPRVLARSVTAATTTSTSAVDLVTISTDVSGDALSIPTTRWARVYFEYRKAANASTAAAFGLKINSTVVLEATNSSGVPRTSATNRAEAGWGFFMIPPRSTSNYGFGIGVDYNCFTTAGAFAASYSNDGGSSLPSMTNAIPNAEITSLSIRAINVTSNEDAEVRNITVEIL